MHFEKGFAFSRALTLKDIEKIYASKTFLRSEELLLIFQITPEQKTFSLL